jgi:hypothetical protein
MLACFVLVGCEQRSRSPDAGRSNWSKIARNDCSGTRFSDSEDISCPNRMRRPCCASFSTSCLPFTASASAVGRRSDGTGWRLDCARRRRMRQVMSGQMSTDTTPLHLDQDHAPGGMFGGGHWSGSGSGGGGYWPYVPAGSPFRDARCSASARAAILACSARRSCSRRQYR